MIIMSYFDKEVTTVDELLGLRPCVAGAELLKGTSRWLKGKRGSLCTVGRY